MPYYDYQCQNGHRTTMYLTLANHVGTQPCACGEMAEQVITAPILVACAQDVCYDSPIDGRPITSWQARTEDLKRNNCQPYDPEMKTDYANRLKRQEAELDKSIEQYAEQVTEKMPTATRGKLYSELTEQGVQAEYVRSTPTS